MVSTFAMGGHALSANTVALDYDNTNGKVTLNHGGLGATIAATNLNIGGGDTTFAFRSGDVVTNLNLDGGRKRRPPQAAMSRRALP